MERSLYLCIYITNFIILFANQLIKVYIIIIALLHIHQ